MLSSTDYLALLPGDILIYSPLDGPERYLEVVIVRLDFRASKKKLLPSMVILEDGQKLPASEFASYRDLYSVSDVEL